MSKFAVPVVLSEDSTLHEAIGEEQVIRLENIPVSTDKKNLLDKDEEGLLLTADGLVSKDENNPISVNIDDKLYIKVNELIDPADKVLKVADNLMLTDIALEFDPAAGKLTLLGKGGMTVSELMLPVCPGLPTVVEILQNYTPPTPDGYEENPYQEGTYLHMQFRLSNGNETDVYIDVAKLVDVYTAGRGISVEDNVISVKLKDGGGLVYAHGTTALMVDGASLVAEDDPVLRADGGKIASQLGVAVDVENNTVQLIGQNGAVIGEAKLPAALGLPTSAEFVDNPAGKPAGKYLKLTFTRSDGTTQDLYLDMSALVDVYTGGPGVDITGNTVSVKLAPGTANPLAIAGASGQLYLAMPRLVSADAGNGLRLGSDNKLYAKSGLDASQAGPGLSLVDGVLQIDAVALAAMLAPLLGGVSADVDNILTEGSDGKPYLPGDGGSL